MPHTYLRNEADDLKMRRSHDYAKDKLTILERYIYRFATSMKEKGWNALNYIDLLAGPGKNRFAPSGDIRLGSPLLSLMTKYPFTNYFFVEKGPQQFTSLEQRVRACQLHDRVHLSNKDCNEAIDEVIGVLSEIDRNRMHGRPSLNLAFIDPEGIEEIEWKTIEKLARQQRMDLIINFSSSAITRNIRRLSNSNRVTAIDKFFGT